MPEADGRRRAGADVEHRAEAVGEVIQPHARVRAPAELRAARDVIDARGPIPRDADVELHVGIVGEQLALAVQRDVHGVAEARRNHLPVLTVRRNPANPAARRLESHRMSRRVGNDRVERVLLPHRRLHGDGPLRHAGEVAAHQIQPLAVGGRDDGMRRVLVAHVEFLQQRELIELVVPVRVANAVEAPHVRHVETVERPYESIRAADFAFPQSTGS